MKAITIYILLIIPFLSFSQTDSVITHQKTGKSIVLKESKFYDYQIQKNKAAIELEISASLLIYSQVVLLIGGALIGVGYAIENEKMAVGGSVVIGFSIPLTIGSGFKLKSASKKLRDASFYEINK